MWHFTGRLTQIDPIRQMSPQDWTRTTAVVCLQVGWFVDAILLLLYETSVNRIIRSNMFKLLDSEGRQEAGPCTVPHKFYP